MKRWWIWSAVVAVILVWGVLEMSRASGEDRAQTRAKGAPAAPKRGRAIQGVAYGPDRAPVAGAMIEVRVGPSLAETESDAHGRFTIELPGRGEVTLVVRPSEAGRRAGFGIARLHRSRPPRSLDVHLPWAPPEERPGCIRLTMRLPEGAEAAEGYLVADRATPFEESSVKERTWSASQGGLPPGRVRLYLRAGEWMAIEDVIVRAGETRYVAPVPRKGRLVRLRVTDGPGGAPLVDATAAAQVEDADRAWVGLPPEAADATGVVVLRGLPERGGVEVSAPGHVTRVLLTFEESEEVPLDRGE